STTLRPGRPSLLDHRKGSRPPEGLSTTGGFRDRRCAPSSTTGRALETIPRGEVAVTVVLAEAERLVEPERGVVVELDVQPGGQGALGGAPVEQLGHHRRGEALAAVLGGDVDGVHAQPVAVD